MDIYSRVRPALAREAADRTGALLLPGKCNQNNRRPVGRAAHALTSFVYDAVIIAVTVNVVAGLST